MPILDGNPVDAPYTNSKLVSKIADGQDLVGTYNLKSNSSTHVNNLQTSINGILAGIAANQNSIVNLSLLVGDNASSIIDIYNELSLGTQRIRSYPSDSDYIIINGPVVGGEFYYNTTTGKARYYDNIDEKWRNIGSSTLGNQENLGIGNGVTTGFTLSAAPITDESLIVYINGVAQDKSSYTVDLPNIIFNSPPELGREVYVFYLTEGIPPSAVISSGSQVLQYRTLTAGEIANGLLTLPSVPSNPLAVMVDYIEAGASLVYEESFVVSGDELSWSGRLIDGFISQGERLRIMYFV